MTSNPPKDLEQHVRARLDSLTKPPGSLGRMEEIALLICLKRGEFMPSTARKAMYIFCADHGVVEEGVSKYPQVVTRQMVGNFLAGGAAINVLCRHLEIDPRIVDAGVCGPAAEGVLNRKIAEGTRNMAKEPAMTRQQAQQALAVGGEMAAEAATSCDLCGLGEMGIGNTTAASAILSVYAECDPTAAVGPGTGVDSETVAHKALVVRRALELHQPVASDGVGVLAAVGGFEIGAIAGFLVAAADLHLPVVLDGFPCTAAALIARAIHPNALNGVFLSHHSAEPGHKLLVKLLGAQPYTDLQMRLGEGTGAALTMGLIDSAVRLYREMATFEEAKVSSAQESPVLGD